MVVRTKCLDEVQAVDGTGGVGLLGNAGVLSMEIVDIFVVQLVGSVAGGVGTFDVQGLLRLVQMGVIGTVGLGADVQMGVIGTVGLGVIVQVVVEQVVDRPTGVMGRLGGCAVHHAGIVVTVTVTAGRDVQAASLIAAVRPARVSEYVEKEVAGDSLTEERREVCELHLDLLVGIG